MGLRTVHTVPAAGFVVPMIGQRVSSTLVTGRESHSHRAGGRQAVQDGRFWRVQGSGSARTRLGSFFLRDSTWASATASFTVADSLCRAPLPATSHGTELQRARFVPSGRWVDVNRDGALFSEPAQLVHSRGRNNHALPLNNDGFVFSADDVEVDVAFVGHGL